MQLSLDIFGTLPVADVQARLLDHFGPQRDKGRLSPVSRLIDGIISSRTYDKVSSDTFLNLRNLFPNWADLMRTPVEKVHELIKGVTYSEDKAPTLIKALEAIYAREQKLSLDFLTQMAPDQALRWLEQINGVGRKISAAVLNFSTLHGYAFVIDTHVLRLSQRLGWLPANVKTAEKAYEPLMALMPEAWDADDLYEFHWLLKKLGQTICPHSQPQCRRCPLNSLCPSSTFHPPPPDPNDDGPNRKVVELFPENPKQKLYAEIAKHERSDVESRFGVVSFGDPRVDSRFPHNGLARGRWHDIGGKGAERETPASAAGFGAALAKKAASQGVILWVVQRNDLYAPGLGLDPDRLIFVKAEKDEGVLAVMESAARTSGVVAIIGEVSSVDLTAGRRLQLACEHHGAIAFALRRQFSAPLRQRTEKHSTEMTRWRIASASSDTLQPGLGPARWETHLERNRNGRAGGWIMEAHNAADEKESPLRVVAELADHQAETRAAPASRLGRRVWRP